MQWGEGASETNCECGDFGYIVSIGNDGGGGKEKNHHIQTPNTTNIKKNHHETYSWINYS